jgi:hypothetical protein
MLNNDYEYPYPSSNFFCTKVKYYDRRSDPDNRVFVPLEVTRSYKDIDLQFKIGRGSYTTPRDKQEMDKLTVGAYKNGFSCRFWLGGTMYQAGLLIYILPDDLPNTDLESEESNAENALFSIVKNVIDQYEENSNEKTT